jgi:hypothetical protein
MKVLHSVLSVRYARTDCRTHLLTLRPVLQSNGGIVLCFVLAAVCPTDVTAWATLLMHNVPLCNRDRCTHYRDWLQSSRSFMVIYQINYFVTNKVLHFFLNYSKRLALTYLSLYPTYGEVPASESWFCVLNLPSRYLTVLSCAWWSVALRRICCRWEYWVTSGFVITQIQSSYTQSSFFCVLQNLAMNVKVAVRWLRS